MKKKLTDKIIRPSNQTKSIPLMKIGSYTILALLVITFVGGPILSNNLQTQADFVFGKYASYEIKYEPSNYFGQSVQGLVEQYSSQISQSSDSNFFLSTAWKQAFDNSVMHYALLDLAKKSRYAPSETLVIDEIKKYPFLQTDGEFDKTLYDNYTDNTKRTIVEFQTEVSTSSKIQTDILNTTYVSAQEIAFLENMNNNRRAFNFVRFSKSEINDREFLRKFGVENSEKFAQIEFKSITVDSEKDAISIYEKITSHEATFEESVTSFSIDSASAQNGERGTLYAFQIESNDGEEALQALLALENNEDISEVIETAAGAYAIYSRISDVQEANFQGIDTNTETATDTAAGEEDATDSAEEDKNILEVVQEYLNTYEPGIVEDHILNTADQFIAQAKESDFTSVAEAQELELGEIPLAPLNVDNVSALDTIRSSDGSVGLSALESKEDILAELFTIENVLEISNAYILSNYVYIFQLSKIESPAKSKVASKPVGTEADTVVETGTDTAEKPDVGISTENDFSNKINSFITSANNQMLRDAVVDEDKLTDNFNEAFRSIYDAQ